MFSFSILHFSRKLSVSLARFFCFTFLARIFVFFSLLFHFSPQGPGVQLVDANFRRARRLLPSPRMALHAARRIHPDQKPATAGGYFQRERVVVRVPVLHQSGWGGDQLAVGVQSDYLRRELEPVVRPAGPRPRVPDRTNQRRVSVSARVPGRRVRTFVSF